MPRDLSRDDIETTRRYEQAEREAYDDERTLRYGSAATLRELLTKHVAEEPSRRIPPGLDVAWYRRQVEQAFAAWLHRLDELSRAYVAALDREGAQMPLALRGVAR